MVEVEFVFVPPSGGEIEYSHTVELPAVPQAGDYVALFEKGESGSRDFIVRRVHWIMLQDGTSSVCVEAEFAVSVRSTEDHQRTVKRLARKKGVKPPEIEPSAY